MAEKKEEAKQEPEKNASQKKKAFEDIVSELRERIEREVGSGEAFHYIMWANGILVFFPEGLRSIVVEGYGNIIAAHGIELADLYLNHLKELYRAEQEASKKGSFSLTRKAAVEAAALLSTCAPSGPKLVRKMRRMVMWLLPQRARLKRETKELFRSMEMQLNRR